MKENTAPKFLIKPLNEYELTRDSAKEETTTINLGSTYDLEQDAVNVELECLSCVNEIETEHKKEQPFIYDDVLKLISVSPSAKLGNYRLQLTLSDDIKDDPKSSTFKFNVVIKEKVEI